MTEGVKELEDYAPWAKGWCRGTYVEYVYT